jgi:prepilin-type N-terminal cleavage/methylation domain-containing protein
MRRKTQGFTLIEIMVVITIIAGLVTAVAIMVPKMQETARQTNCLSNLNGLGQLYITKAMDKQSSSQKYSGVALWLSYRKTGQGGILRGQEKALMCPGDPSFRLPENEEDRKLWDNVDLDNPTDDLCSYAARDFKNHPISVESPEKEIIGCDRQGSNGRTPHHRGVIICTFNEGDAQKMTREELGIATDEDIVVGPEASSKMLQNVIYIKRKSD